jgi:hypothetical protein
MSLDTWLEVWCPFHLFPLTQLIEPDQIGISEQLPVEAVAPHIEVDVVPKHRPL